MSLYNRLLAEITRREAIAKAAGRDSGSEHWVPGMFRTGSIDISDHIALHDPTDAQLRYTHYRKTLELHYPSRYQDWPPQYGTPPVSCGSCAEDWPCTDVVHLAEALGIAATVGEEHFAPEEEAP